MMSKERDTPISDQLEDAKLEIQILFAKIAFTFGEKVACGLFKKYVKPTRLGQYRDIILLSLFSGMKNPKKQTFAKIIDPKNPHKVLAQLKRALRNPRYARFRKGLAMMLTEPETADRQAVRDNIRAVVADGFFPGRQ
jgi:hypothetical protein